MRVARRGVMIGLHTPVIGLRPALTQPPRRRGQARTHDLEEDDYRRHPGSRARPVVRCAEMRGSMRERSPGCWQLRVYEGTDPTTGKKCYRTASVRGTRRIAQSRLAALVAALDGDGGRDTRRSVGVLLESWLVHIEQLGRSPSTLYGYRRLVAQLPPRFKATPLASVTPRLLDELYRVLAKPASRGPATVLRFHAMLRAAFAQACRWGWLDRNPAQVAASPRVTTMAIQPPYVADIVRVLDSAARSRNPENGLVFRVLAATGCRRGEVCGLRWSDVDLKTSPARLMICRAVIETEGDLFVRTTKTHAARVVTLDDSTADLLRAYRDQAVVLGGAPDGEVDPDGFVFRRAPSSADPLPPNRLSQAWRRLCRESGVSSRLHDLRHLQASLLLDAGEPLTVVAGRLGHRDASTTLKIYAHVMPGGDTRAAAIVATAFADAQSPHDESAWARAPLVDSRSEDLP
jgi:integrase